MTIDINAKKYILRLLKESIEGMQKYKFNGLRKLVPRFVAVGELYPDEVWTKELNLIGLAIAIVGATTESEFRRMEKDEKDTVIKQYTEFLNSLFSAIEEESAPKVDALIKDFATLFFRDVGS